jgi:hypothetical protein
MRLIDGELRDAPLSQHVHRAIEHQPLGRRVEQPEFAVEQSAQSRTRLIGFQRRVQESGLDAAGRERIDLVLHQGE